MDDRFVEAKTLDEPESERVFLDGSTRGEVQVGRDVVGRGVYRPGWRWSTHVRPLAGAESAAHTFSAAPGHDAWVIGNEPCVALDFRTT